MTAWIEKCKIKLQHYKAAKKRLIKEKSIRSGIANSKMYIIILDVVSSYAVSNIGLYSNRQSLQEKIKRSHRQIKVLEENQKSNKTTIDQLQNSINNVQVELKTSQAQRENLQFSVSYTCSSLLYTKFK